MSAIQTGAVMRLSGIGELRRDPRVAISCLDFTRPQRSVELRGELVAVTLYGDLTFVNLLARSNTQTSPQRG